MRFAQERRDGAIKNKYIKINNKGGMRGTFATRYVEVYLISSSLRGSQHQNRATPSTTSRV